MATNKTLSPTNVTISIPAMTDVPDASVFSNCVDKEADAINVMSDKIGKTLYYSTTPINASTTSLTLSGLSDYNVFCGTLGSTYSTGSIIGVRSSATAIRFFGASGSSSGIALTTMSFTVSGDTISSVGATLGTSATGITQLFGIA